MPNLQLDQAPGTQASGRQPVVMPQSPQPQERTVDGSSRSDLPAPHEPLHVLSTHRIQSLEAHVNMRSNLQSASTGQATVSGSEHAYGPSTNTLARGQTSSGKNLEATLGSLDISGRPEPSLIPRLHKLSEEDAPEIPVFKVVAACYHRCPRECQLLPLCTSRTGSMAQLLRLVIHSGMQGYEISGSGRLLHTSHISSDDNCSAPGTLTAT